MGKMKNNKVKKLGLLSLSSVVLSAMIGGGIFDLPKNMASVAGAKAQIIAWIVAGIDRKSTRLNSSHAQ